MIRQFALAATLSWSAVEAIAWEFTPGLPCLLTHEGSNVSVELTYDPSIPLYSISIMREAPFQLTQQFSLQFRGGMSLTIGTDRQKLSDNNRKLTVTDSGFGNVLNGLQFNSVMTAFVGSEQIDVSLNGAAKPVEQFRNCRARPLA